MIVVAVRLVRNAVRRAEMNAARDRPAGIVIKHFYMHPVLARIYQSDPHTPCFCVAFFLDVAPFDRSNICFALPHR